MPRSSRPPSPFEVFPTVPYISQWENTAKLSRGDCGIVAACMVARWQGVQTTPDQMILLAGLPSGRLHYSIAEVIQAANAVGTSLKAVPNATWPVIQAELHQNRPVITLLAYGKITGNQDGHFKGSHFWTCIGYDEAHVYVHDPDWAGIERRLGSFRAIPLTEFQQAIGSALLALNNQPYQSLFLA